MPVLVTDSLATTRTVTTDANGDYTTQVVTGSTIVDIDQNDPSVPQYPIRTAGTDPQTLAVLAGQTVNAVPVGYLAGGILIGKVYNDVNGNGTQDLGEPGLGGVTVTIVPSLGTTYTVVTASSGAFGATIPSGNATVDVDDSTLPTGSVLTGGLDPQTVSVTAGVPNYAVPTGYQVQGTVSGHLFDDLNGNGSQDPGEPGLSGVTVLITDSQGTTQTVTTNANGDYQTTVSIGSTTADVDDSSLPAGATITTGTDPQTVTVSAASNTATDPIGYQMQGTISGHLFDDINGNGTQDPGEPGLSGIDVTITDSLGSTYVVTTDANGDYQTTVPTGSTTADVDDADLPPGATITTGTDPQTVTVTGGADAPTTPIGYQMQGTVSGHLFDDVNGNGTQDPGEPGLSGVTVTITDSQGTTQTVSTDANGDYQTTVPVGSTTADVDDSSLPAGATITTGTDPQTVTAVGGTDTPTAPIGYQMQGTVSGHLFDDINGNGTQDPGEPGLSGVTVTITDSQSGIHTATTDANGDYQTTVPIGSTTADVNDATLPAGATITTGTDPQTVTVSGGADAPTAPIGYQMQGTISGHLFDDINGNGTQDPGEPGLNGVTVIITDSQSGTHSVTTDANGDYQTTVPIGSTTANVDDSTLPAGANITTGTDPQTVTVTGASNAATDPIGYQMRGTISGHLFDDVNGNGTQDPGEPGLTGVTVTITDSLGTTQTVTTDANGDYQTSVPVGSTIADVDDASLPAGANITTGTDPQTVTVSGGTDTATDPIGYQMRGNFSGHLFDDVNGNGTQDPGEPGLSGVSVLITDSQGTTQTVTTDANGDYLVTVPVGSTTADVDDATLPAGANITAGTDPQTVMVTGAATAATDPIGYQMRGTVSGHLFDDVNGNGTQDPGEPGLGGVTVTVVDSQGTTQTVSTDANGDYQTTVPVGSTLTDVDDGSLPAGANITTGTDPQTVTVPGGADAATDPIGYQMRGTVSGHLFDDVNGNGTQDPGEPGLGGVNVTITDSQGTTQSVTTDANGDYQTTVPVGSTTADVDDASLPAGATITTGTDPQTVTAAGGTDTPTAPIGYQMQGTVSGHLFDDVNGNGTQDPGEPGLSGVTVTITDSQSGTHTATTDANGDYQTTVPVGSTTADVDDSSLPAGAAITAGTDPQTVTAVGGTDTPTAPIGYQMRGTISGHLFDDVNGNGTQDPGEPGLSGVSVTITDSQGTTQSVTTDANGDYQTTVPVGSTTADVDDSSLPAGATITTGTDPQTVTVSGGADAATDPIGYQMQGTISGHVFHDANGNGTQDPGETGLPGITVVITDSQSGIHNATTDANGDYQTTVPIGSTTADVDESTLPPFWFRTAGTDPQTVTVIGGADTATGPVGYRRRTESDINISKSASPNPVLNGQPLTYTIVVGNDGPDAAANVIVEDGLPPTVTFDSASPGCVLVGTTVTCALGTLPAGDTTTVTIVVTPTTTGTLSNTAVVSTTNTDPNPEDNTTPPVETTVEAAADLALLKTASPDPVFDGQNLTYSILASNFGPDPATSVTITDLLPPGVSLISMASSCSILGSTVTCELGTIPSGEIRAVTILVKVETTGTLTNSAAIVATEADPDPSDNTSEVDTTALPAADLAVSKSASPDPVLNGQKLTYTITAVNDGPDAGTSVKVEDTLPAGVTFDSASPECSFAAGKVTCNLASLASGDTKQFTVVVVVHTTGTITNSAVISGNEEDTHLPDNVSPPVNTTAVSAADLSVVKTASPDPVLDGQNITYTITASNAGPDTATSVSVEDTLPSGVTFVSASPECAFAAGKVTCSLASLATSATKAFTVVVQANVVGTITNSAIISGDEADPDLPNNTSPPVSTTSVASADLSVTKSASPDPVLHGQNLTYTLTASNAGPDAATLVKVEDTLPAGVSFVSASPECVFAAGKVTCSVASLASGDTKAFTVVVQVDTTGTITNSAVISGDEVDPDPSDNTSPPVITTAVESADLSVTKSASPDPVLHGQNLTYTLTASNAGPDAATLVKVEDTLPAGVSFVSASPECVFAAGKVTCSVASLATSATKAFTVVVQVNTTGTITNTAVVSGAQADPDPPDNTSPPVNTTALESADLSVTKSASPNPVLHGQNLTYTLTASNAGPDAATLVKVEDTLPAGVSFVSASPECVFAAGKVTCSLASLATSATKAFTVVVQVNTTGTITNSAVVSGAQTDPNPPNNTSPPVNTTAVESADLSVTKSASPNPVLHGQNLTYTLTASNAGPDAATLVKVEDTLPAGVSFVSASPECVFAAGKVTCSLASLATSATKAFTVVVQVNTTGTITNTAVVSGTQADPDPPDNTSPPVNTTSVASADVSVTKSASPNPVVHGQNITYTLTATNAGPDAATLVKVEDTLPPGVSFVSASPECSFAAGKVTCSVASLATSATKAFTVVVRADAVGVITNVAIVSAAEGDPAPLNNISPPAQTTVDPASDLSITKTASPDPVLHGQLLVYTITTLNSGPDTATGVMVDDILPAGVSFVSASPECANLSGTLTCNLGSMAADTSKAVTLVVRVETTGTITNAAVVSGNENDPDPGDNTTPPVITTAVPSADLSVIKSADPEAVLNGGQVTYTIVATNAGPDTATSVTVEDDLPEGVAFVSASPQCSLAGSLVTCDLGTLAASESTTLTIVVRIEVSGTVVNVADIFGNEADPDTGNNVSPPVLVGALPVADLSVTKSASPDPVVHGQNLTYTMVVTNDGPDTATMVVLQDLLSTGVTFISASPGCTLTSGILTCDLGDMDPASSKSVSMVVRVDMVGTVVNSATVSGLETDPDPTDNTTPPVETPALATSDLSVVKTASPNPVMNGQPLTYVITVSNAGLDAAGPVTVQDTLPSGVTVDSIPPECSLAVATVTCDIGIIGVGGSKDVTIVVRPTAVGTLTNTAQASAPQVDPNPSDNISPPVETTVVPAADMYVTLAAAKSPVVVDTPETYTLVIGNLGPDTATSVTLINTLPVASEFVGVLDTAADCTLLAGSVICTLDSLDPGTTAGVTIVAKPETTGTQLDLANVTANEGDPFLDNNSTSVTVISQEGFHPHQDDNFTTWTGYWVHLGLTDPTLVGYDWDTTNTSLRGRVFSCGTSQAQLRFRAAGWMTEQPDWMPYASVGSTNNVRVKYFIYTTGQANPANLNEIPTFRVRAASRFAYTANLEVIHHDRDDPGNLAMARELRPSTDPQKPSLYRVDFDPVDVPFLAQNAGFEGILRAFDAFSFEPQENGYIAMTESIIGTYPSALLSDSLTSPVQVYQTSASDAGDLKVYNPTELQILGLVYAPGAVQGQFPLTTTVGLGTYSESSAGVTLSTTNVSSSTMGLIVRDYNPDDNTNNYAAHPRVEEGKLYKMRFHVTSTQRSNINAPLWLRGRAVKFAWTQKMELGGPFSAGNQNNTIAKQTLPGIGCLNPDKNGTENGGWYTLLLHTPLYPELRPEFPDGTPVSVRMPNIAGQPGPGVNSPSVRDIRVGTDLFDTQDNIVPGFWKEAGNYTIDRIEIRTYDRPLE